MPAEFESGFFGGREPAWHGLGTVIDEDVVTGKRALKLSGLDWLVRKIPLLGIYEHDGQDTEIEIPSHCGIQREDTLDVLGVVTSGYEPFQNHQLFELVDAIQDSGEAKFHTAGSLRGGRYTWALARLVEGVEIAGDRIDPFLLMTNAHDGTRALTAVMTPVRVVCTNTLNAALAGALRSWSVRHTSGIHERAREAREALGLAFTYMEQFESVGNELTKRKMSRRDFSIFLEQLVPYKPGTEADSRAAKNVDEARDTIQAILAQADDLANVRDRWWGGWNAVAEYVDHVKPQRTVYGSDGETVDERTMRERRFTRVVLESDLKQQALRIIDPKLASTAGDNLAIAAGMRG
jgi:phage/plasmid-like protein (TIGR03299 family)